MKYLLQLLVLFAITACAPQHFSSKPYNNRFGGFDRKEDADCAFLVFQRDAQRNLGDKWEEVYEQCKRLSLAGTPLTPKIYNELNKAPSSANSINTANSLGNAFVALLAVLQQAQKIEMQRQEIEMQRQALQPSQPPQFPQPSHRSIRCTTFGNTTHCNEF